MKKTLPYLIAVAASLALCAVALLVPTEAGALWQQPCINAYSAFAALSFVMNTIGLCVLAGNGEIIWQKPYTAERTDIEAKKRRVTAAVLAFFEAPLLLTVFYVNGGWKMAACSALFVGGSLVLGGLIGEASVSKMRKEFKATEQRELAEQRKKEEG